MSADQQTRVGQGCRRSRQGKKNSAVSLSSNVPKTFAQFRKDPLPGKLKPFKSEDGAGPVPLQACRMIIRLLLETLHCGLSAWGRPLIFEWGAELMAMGTAAAGWC